MTDTTRKTTVSVSEETKKQLAKFGSKGESFDEILHRVMDKADSFCAKEEQGKESDPE